MKKARNLITPGSADPGIAVLAGDAFFRHAQQFIQASPSNIEVSNHYAVANLGELIASATMLPLAIELYLKALLLREGKPAPRTHELPALFSELPSFVRQQCETRYDNLRESEGEGTAGFEIQVFNNKLATQHKWRERPESPPTDHSFRAVLMRSSSAFVTWRYLFAISPGIIPESITYEFLRLSLIARSVREVIGSARLHVRIGS